jgi:hypothetical protein
MECDVLRDILWDPKDTLVPTSTLLQVLVQVKIHRHGRLDSHLTVLVGCQDDHVCVCIKIPSYLSFATRHRNKDRANNDLEGHDNSLTLISETCLSTSFPITCKENRFLRMKQNMQSQCNNRSDSTSNVSTSSPPCGSSHLMSSTTLLEVASVTCHWNASKHKKTIILALTKSPRAPFPCASHSSCLFLVKQRCSHRNYTAPARQFLSSWKRATLSREIRSEVARMKTAL